MREGIIELGDGRRIAYREFGPVDGPVVIYCHGFPGSRRELALTEPVAERSGVRVRLIALNRPGYGPSTFVPGYEFLDWPHDVAAVADHLGIGEFAVVGASGGCPYALACGLALADRVTRVGIVVGVTPLEATGMSTAPGTTQIPKTYAVRRLQYGLVAAAARTPFRDQLVHRMHRNMSPVDKDALERAGAWFVAVVREAFADGGRAAAHEARLYLRPWDFDVAHVTTATRLWYGGEDRTIPASAGRWLATRLPNPTFTLWPEHGHFSWASSREAVDVLKGMIDDNAS
jgi:pimeloyl-ACP methyl ester carboxylesterase